jgi:hypothetical protein
MSPRACLLAVINACHRLTEESQMCVCVCVCVFVCVCVCVCVCMLCKYLYLSIYTSRWIVTSFCCISLHIHRRALIRLADVDVLLSLPVLSSSVSYNNTTLQLDGNSTSSNSSGDRISVLVWWRYKKAHQMVSAAAAPAVACNNCEASNFLGLQAITHGPHTIELSADLGIRLPPQGLPPGVISLSSDSPSGPIAPTYGWSAGLGEFYVSFITFAPPQAGTQSGIVVLLCLSQQMRA